MEDTLLCPICGNKLRNLRLSNTFLSIIDKEGNFIERTCTQGHNHSLMLFVDEDTQKVELLKVSLTTQYSRFVEINYALGKSRLSYLKNNRAEYIDIDKVLEADFPALEKIKEKCGILITFS